MFHLLLHYGNGAAFLVLALLMTIIDVRCTRNNYREFIRMKVATVLMGYCGAVLGLVCAIMMATGIEVTLLLANIVPLYYYLVMTLCSYTIIQALKVRDIYTNILYFAAIVGFFLLFFDMTAFFLDDYDGAIWSQDHFLVYQQKFVFRVISIVTKVAFALFAVYLLIFVPYYGYKYAKKREEMAAGRNQKSLDGIMRLLISTVAMIAFGIMENVFPEEWSHYLFVLTAPLLYVILIDAIMRINFEAMAMDETTVGVESFSVANEQATLPQAQTESETKLAAKSALETELEREKAQQREKVLAIAEASEQLFKVESETEEPEEEPVEEEEEEVDVKVDVQSLSLSDRERFMELLVEKWAERKSRPYTDVTLTVGALAAELKLPERVLSRVIHDKYGLTFNSWLNYLRMNDIKRQLDENPNARVTTLFREMGFSDTSTATKIFKRFVGMTPTEYKQQLSS